MIKVLVLIPLLVSVILAADTGGFNIRSLLPVATGAGGIALTLLGLLPIILRLQRAVREAAEETQKFVEKYRGRINQDDIKRDLRKLFQRYDVVTEIAADVAKRFRMRQTERWLRDLIGRKIVI